MTTRAQLFLHRTITRILGIPEEINGAFRCDTYLYRWFVLKRFKAPKIYLHHFVGNDWSRDLHDHPKRFISVGLWGSYIEETPYQGNAQWAQLGPIRKTFRAPWVRSFPATHIHRLTVPSKNCWTLVITLKETRPWGFWHLGRFIPWKHYVRGVDSKIADEMRDC